MNQLVFVTGGVDPIHSGPIAFFKAAKKLGDQLVVGVNSDAWLYQDETIGQKPAHRLISNDKSSPKQAASTFSCDLSASKIRSSHHHHEKRGTRSLSSPPPHL